METNYFLQILTTLYPPQNIPHHQWPNQQQQAQAQKALYELMAEPQAWDLASEVLDSLDKHDWAMDTNARFMASHILAVKISRDWDSFPEKKHLFLKDRLLDWLVQSAIRTSTSTPGEKIVLRKLSVAISVLSFKLVPEPLRCWDHWLLEIISRLSAIPNVQSALLEVLTVIAEEAERADMLGGRRAQYDQSIQDGSPLVIRTLVDDLRTADLRIRISALVCSQAWLCSSHLNIDGPLTLWPILLELLFTSAYLAAYADPTRTTDEVPDEEEEIVQKVADCLEELVSGGRAGTAIGGGFVTKTRAVALLDWFSSDLVGAIIEHSIVSGEVPDAILSIYKLFASLSEHSIAEIAGQLSTARNMKLVEHLLRLSTFPGYGGIDENVSPLILPIWTLLQEELNDLGYLGSGAEEDGAPLAGHTELQTLSVDLFIALARALKAKSVWPSPDHIARNWTSDFLIAFKSHTRPDLAEALLACYYVCRDRMLLELVDQTKALLVKITASEGSYEELEACFFCIRAIQDGIPTEEERALPEVFGPEVLGKLPVGSTAALVRLQGTCLGLIASFSEWLKHHPHHLLCALNLVGPALSAAEPEIVSLAANALRLLCDDGRKVLVQEIAPLAGLIRTTEGKISPDEYNKVVQAVASVLQALPSSDLVFPLLSFIDPVLRRLDLALQQHSQAPDAYNKMTIITQLQQLKACNQGLSEPDEDLILLDIDDAANAEKEKMNQLAQLEPIRNLRATLTHLISIALVQSAGDVDMAIPLSELVRSCTSSTIPTAISLDPFLLLTTCISNISRDHINLAIWFSLSTSLIIATSRLKGADFDQDQYHSLMNNIKESVKVAASVLNTEAQMVQEPNLVQTFLQFCSAVIERYGAMFEGLETELTTIMTIAVASLKVEERGALQAGLEILRVFANQTHKSSAQAPVFLRLLSRHGYDVFNHIILAISGLLPRSALPNLAETLHCFFVRLPQLAQIWLAKLFEIPGYPNEKVSAEKKARFMKNIVGARTLKKARDLCTEFAIVARGLEGTAYGASHLSLAFAD